MLPHEDDWCEHGVLEGGVAWLIEAFTVSVLQGRHPLVTREASMVGHCRRLPCNVHVKFRMHSVLEILQNGVSGLLTAFNLAE